MIIRNRENKLINNRIITLWGKSFKIKLFHFDNLTQTLGSRKLAEGTIFVEQICNVNEDATLTNK